MALTASGRRPEPGDPHEGDRPRCQAILPPPAELQEEGLLHYDVAEFPFLPAVKAAIGELPESDLALLHRGELGMQVVSRNAQFVPRDMPWQRRFRQCAEDAPGVFAEFRGIYHRFLRNVVLPLLGTRTIAFETLPLLRCHLPGEGTEGNAHRDEESGHEACELNFWVPMTPASGTSSLFAESKRGLQDFHPFEVPRVGGFVRFYGSQVWHYTAANATDATRVSFDFRVIRREEWTRAAFGTFPLGGHYSVLDGELGVLERDSEEMLRMIRQFS